MLGSLPGDASLAAQRYYAHPTNQFWRLLGGAIGEELQALTMSDRLERLAERRIGLWDVIASASRRGQPRPGDPRGASTTRSSICCTTFPTCARSRSTARRPRQSGRKLIGDPPPRIALIDLPSSSAANTRPFADKAAAWSVLRRIRCIAGAFPLRRA